jgi:hypothetical protein
MTDSVKRERIKAIKLILVLSLLVVAIVGGLVYGSSRILVKKMSSAKTVVETLRDGRFTELARIHNASIQSAISRSGQFVALVGRKDLSGKERGLVLSIFDLQKKELRSFQRDYDRISSPVWAPDDQSVFYFADDGKKTVLRRFFCNADRDEIVQEYTVLLSKPKLSPDFRYITYTAKDESGLDQVFIADKKGVTVVKLTNATSSLYVPRDVFWFPDSSAIGVLAFNSVLILKKDGSLLATITNRHINLANARSFAVDPANPDHLYFVSHPVYGLFPNLYRYSFSRQTLEKVRKAGIVEAGHTFSPTGDRFMYVKG